MATSAFTGKTSSETLHNISLSEFSSRVKSTKQINTLASVKNKVANDSKRRAIVDSRMKHLAHHDIHNYKSNHKEFKNRVKYVGSADALKRIRTRANQRGDYNTVNAINRNLKARKANGENFSFQRVKPRRGGGHRRSGPNKWTSAVNDARKQLGITGFVKLTSKPDPHNKEGYELWKTAKEIMNNQS